MAEPAGRAATYDDILALPENLVGEILHGQLHTMPRPAPRHARAYSALGSHLGGPFDWGTDGPGGWWIIDEPELTWSVMCWRREGMPALPETAWFELAPDWVCENLSPGTARTDRVIEMPI
jgi:hypothetical protein